MTPSSNKKQPHDHDREPSHPSGITPTLDDAESRMTSEGDITAMDESQAGRMGEGLRGERATRHTPPPPGRGAGIDQTAEPDGQFPADPAQGADRERPGAPQNRHGDRGGTS